MHLFPYRRVLPILLIAVLLLSLFSTNSRVATADVVQPTALHVDSVAVTIEIGGQHISVATIEENNLDVTEEAEWISSNPAVATVDKGIITGVSHGEATISVTYQGLTQLINVTVNPRYELDSIAFVLVADPLVLSENGFPRSIMVQAVYLDAPSRFVAQEGVWTSSDTNVVTVAGGTLSPVGVGEAEITFSYLTKTLKLTVKVTPELKGLWLNNSQPVIQAGHTHSIVVKKLYSDDSTGDLDETDYVAFTVDDDSIATISDEGVITAVSEGKTVVRISYGDMLPIEIPVSVTSPRVITGLTSMTASMNVKVGGKAANPPSIIGHYSDSTDQVVTSQVTWSTEDASIASVSSEGIVTGVAVGATNLIISLNEITIRIPVTIENIVVIRSKVVSSIYTEPGNVELKIGDTRMLITKQVYSDASEAVVSARYVSSNSEVAKVDQMGMVTAVSSGTATITASSAFFRSTVTVTVLPAKEGDPSEGNAIHFPTVPTTKQPVFNTDIVNISFVAKMMTGGQAGPAVSYKDPLPSWGGEAIERATRLGIISGYLDSTFKADKEVTRAEFAKMVAAAFGIASKEASGFTDTQGHWAAKEIAALQGAGVLSGYGDGTYHPDKPVTRAEMITILSRLTRFVSSAGGSFDDTTGHWADEAIRAFGQAGVITGKADGQFDPDGAATRAESVKIIIGLLDVLTGNPSDEAV